MIIHRIHQLVKLKFNELDSNRRVDLPAPLLDDVINTVIHDYVEIFYSGKSLNRYGFEVTQQRIDMLSTLVESETLTPILKSGVYEVNFSKLKKQYMHLVRAFASTNCGQIGIDLIQHDDLNQVLKDPLRGPSLIWRRLSAVQRTSSDTDSASLYIYTNNLVVVDDVTIEYIRCPKKVFSGGYDSLEYKFGNKSAYKSADSPVTSDIPEKYHEMIVDMTVQELTRIFQDQGITLQTEKILTKI